MTRLAPLLFLATTGLAQADSDACLTDPNHYKKMSSSSDLSASLERSKGQASSFELDGDTLNFMCGETAMNVMFVVQEHGLTQTSPLAENHSWKEHTNISFPKEAQSFSDFASSIQHQCQLTLKND